MRKQTQNNFSKGFITDFNPLTLPPDALVEAKNIEFITTEGNQIILQKRVGNDPEEWGEFTVGLSPGFKPLAVKELNNIAYIISHNETTGEGEIGTFPSPDYEGFQWKAVGSPLAGAVSLTTTDFDDGLIDEAAFSVTPLTYGDEYFLRDAVQNYVFTVTNLAQVTDTFQISYPLDMFTCLVPQITLAPGAVGTFTLTLKTTSTGSHYNTSVTVISFLDSDVKKEIIWDFIGIYTSSAIQDVSDYYSIASYSNNNIDNVSSIPASNYGTILVKVDVNPAYLPYRVDLKVAAGPSGYVYWRATGLGKVNGSYDNDGSVTYVDVGYDGDGAPAAPGWSVATPMTYVEVNRSCEFELILPKDWLFINAFGSNIFITFAPTVEVSGGSPIANLDYKGDLAFNNYADNPNAVHKNEDNGESDPQLQTWYWWDSVT